MLCIPSAKLINQSSKHSQNLATRRLQLIYSGTDNAARIRPKRSMSDITYERLPKSYRLSQSTMLASVGFLFFARQLPFQFFGPVFQIAIWVIVAGIAALAVATACYVVIRYPYLSLVSTTDDDKYSQQFVSKRLLLVVKIIFPLGILFFCLGTTIALFNGTGNLTVQAITLPYFYCQFIFSIFLCFWYDPISHPTIATFIRATLGIGLVLAPILIPVLLIGSFRCKRLLDAQSQSSNIETT